MITLEMIYVITGLLLVLFAIGTLKDKAHKARISSAIFWGLYAVTFIFGKQLPGWLSGLAVIVMVVLAGMGKVVPGSIKDAPVEKREERAKLLRNKLFIPTLTIPIVTFLIAQFTDLGALIGLGIGSIAAAVAAVLVTKDSVGNTNQEGRRLLDSIGTVAILPQLLAALGALFAAAGVGEVVAKLVSGIVPANSVLAAVIAYAGGMALFTIIMGNAFAAFAVITAGIGVPLVIVAHGADPNIIAPLAMTAGYCGTLVTPMAANFNIVPAALLEMKDKYGVIKTQLVVAIPLFIAHIFLMYWLAF